MFTTPLAEHYMYFTSHTSAKLDIFSCHTHKGDNTGQMLHLPDPFCLFWLLFNMQWMYYDIILFRWYLLHYFGNVMGHLSTSGVILHLIYQQVEWKFNCPNTKTGKNPWNKTTEQTIKKRNKTKLLTTKNPGLLQFSKITHIINGRVLETRILSTWRSGNTAKVHRLANLSPKEKGTVEVKMGCRVVLRWFIFCSVSQQPYLPYCLGKKNLQNLKRFSTGNHKAAVRHNTFLHRDCTIHKQLAELWKKTPSPSVL